jgi:alpha-methylacyl-CoA racemase
VVSLSEAPAHPHLAARATFTEVDGITQPAPAPRFSRTQGQPGRIAKPGAHTREILDAWNVPDPATLLADGVVTQA